MITILGDHDIIQKKIIIVLLSKKKYSNVDIFVNNVKVDTFDIKQKIKRIIVNLKNYNMENITIKFIHKSCIIESIENLNLLTIFDNVEIVNCDSTLGLEKNLWDRLENINGSYLIHCGDQIYNDKIFKKYYRKTDLTKKNLRLLKKEIFENYYYQFSRYKNVLKNNLNLMIPDDHEVVDDAYENKHHLDKNFTIIKNVFVRFYKYIQLGLKFSQSELYFVHDNKNKSIFVLNYKIEFNAELLEKYNFDDEISNYKNIIIVSRKSLLSYEINPINQLIFSQKPKITVDIDLILKKQIDTGKNMYIFCGDDHSYKKSIIKYYGKKICTIITCGSINTVPEIIKDKIILNTNIPNIKIKNISYELANNFVKINYIGDKIYICENLEKKSVFFYFIDNIINVYNLL